MGMGGLGFGEKGDSPVSLGARSLGTVPFLGSFASIPVLEEVS